MDRGTFHQTRLLEALSNLALNTAREGAARAPLGKRRKCRKCRKGLRGLQGEHTLLATS